MKLMTTRTLILPALVFTAWLGNGTVGINTDTSFVASAEARLGRPATPVSYAGVARRTTRRAVTPGVGAPGVGVRPGVGVGAPGVGYSRGVGANRGGPVNRVGIR